MLTNHPPYSAEVKKRVELHFYTPFEPSWPDLGWTLLIFVHLLAMGWRSEESWFDFCQGQEIGLLCKTSTPDVGTTQPTIHWISEALFTGVNSESKKMTTHLHWVLRTTAAIHPLPSTPLCMQREECTFMLTSDVCPVHRRNMGRRKPTRCYTMFYWTCNLLNMFQVCLCPSSGARDYTASMAWGV